MLLVVTAEPGVVELNFTWMPLWIGMNSALKKEIEEAIAPVLIGKPLTEETLQNAHDLIINFLVNKFPAIEGLRDYLDAVKFVDAP